MELSDQQKRLARVADGIAGMLEQAARLVPHVPGEAGPVTVEEATVLHSDSESPDEAMLWGRVNFNGRVVDMSGFHLTLGEYSYRMLIEEL